jgi:hypothetical protein
MLQLDVGFDHAHLRCAPMDHLLKKWEVEVDVDAIVSAAASNVDPGHFLPHGGRQMCFAVEASELPLASVFEVGKVHWSLKLFDQHDNLDGGRAVQC